ncbi:hypothetical protein SAMN05192563_102479 [Paraburkholderia aspalathi]|uniref:Uncharacterized protein n=1 Tax=Paraburkholderia aspalathi TaxID=1324617 RepID=A0A1I7EJC0_9BURK|nr:hypothetical protein SAMN05192563_102479 [Paraburkholderia aspalathi]
MPASRPSTEAIVIVPNKRNLPASYPGRTCRDRARPARSLREGRASSMRSSRFGSSLRGRSSGPCPLPRWAGKFRACGQQLRPDPTATMRSTRGWPRIRKRRPCGAGSLWSPTGRSCSSARTRLSALRMEGSSTSLSASTNRRCRSSRTRARQLAFIVPVRGAVGVRAAHQHGPWGGCAVSELAAKLLPILTPPPLRCKALRPRASGPARGGDAQAVSCVAHVNPVRPEAPR